METLWRVQITVPTSQEHFFDSNSFIARNRNSITFHLMDLIKDADQIRTELGNFEDSLEAAGIRDFSLEASFKYSF